MAPSAPGGLTAVRSSDAAHEALRKEGRTVEALAELERGLFLRREVLGDAHPEVEKSCVAYVSFANSTAMTALQAGDLVLSFELLKKAEIVTEPRGLIRDKMARMKMRAITFNNLGCFYRRRGKLHSSIQYLDKALRIELTVKKVDNPAGTHLNMCAVLSQMGKHAAALEHALCALSLLEDAFDPLSVAGIIGRESIAKPPSMLAIASHNAGVEYEYMGKYEEATDNYRRAAHVATIYWGEDHPKTRGIKKSLRHAEAILRGEDNSESFGAEESQKAPRVLPSLQVLQIKSKASISGQKRQKHTKESLRDRMLLHLEWEPGPDASSASIPQMHGSSNAGVGSNTIATINVALRAHNQGAMMSPNSKRAVRMSGSLGALMFEAYGGDLLEDMQGLAGSDEAMMLKMHQLEARLAEFERKAERGELGIGGGGGRGKVIRCKCETYEDVHIIMVPLDSSLEALWAQIEKDLKIHVSFTLRYIDVEGDTLPLKSDMALSNSIQDSLVSQTKTLRIRVHTVLDQEREEAEEAMRIAEKERLEMEAAEQDAMRERDEAEEAERQAEAARQSAIAAQKARRKEEEEAEAAEAEAAAARIAEEKAKRQLDQLREEQKLADKKLKELTEGGGEEAAIEEAKREAERAASNRNKAEQTFQDASAEAAIAEEDAQRERLQAVQARAAYEKERLAAEDAEKIALKERSEYEAARRVADRERAEYEEAQRVADKEMAEYQQIKVKTEVSPGQSTPQRSDSPSKKASKYFADAEETNVVTNEDAARLICNNFRVHVCKKKLRTLSLRRVGEQRKRGATTLQRVYRGHICRAQHRKLLGQNRNERVRSCATKLQSVFRGHLAREHALKIRVREARKSVFMSRYLIHDVAMPQFQPKEGAEGAALREQTVEHYQQLCRLMLFGRDACTAEDTKRSKGNAFRHVLIRFHDTKAQHARELAAFRNIYGTLQDLPTLREAPPMRPLNYISMPIHHSLSADLALSPVVSRHCIVFKQPQMLLSDYIAKHRDSGEKDAIVVREIVDALAFLHDNNFVHTTLEAKSFGLVGDSWALIDLRDSHKQGDELDLTLPNLRSLPVPEVMNAVRLIDDGVSLSLQAHPAIDVFLIGLLIHHILAGKPLFRDFESAKKQLDDDEDVVVGMGRCKDLVGKYAVENSLCRTPSERMTVKELQTLLRQLNSIN